MKKLENIFLIASVSMLILSIIFSIAVAAPTGASVTQVGDQERGSESSSPGQVQTQGGNLTYVNVSAYQITGKWAGFYGNISGDIRLADSSNNIFYKWTISDPTGSVVYVCTGTVSSWTTANIVPLYANDNLLPSFLKSGADSFNVTFTSQEQFTSASLTINNVNYTYTYSSNQPGNTFKTYALKATNENVMIWAGKAVRAGTSFKNTAVDYQVLAGVPAQYPNTVTFYFYLELP
ncbi:MAG: hypothetical protein QW480_00330 [Candidatus Aenigmatarchaeota archaeon]